VTEVPDQLVRAWLTAIHGACFVPMSRPERHAFVRQLAGRLAAAMRTEPFDPAAGYEVGSALVAADYSAPEVLARTITVLHGRLLDDLGMAGDRLAEARRGALVEGVAAGFARALRDRTLDAQEEIRHATTVARADAEQELRASEARYRYAAMHDPLTNLPNERLLVDRLKRLLTDPSAETRLGLCYIDLDRFEAINDSLGPRVGDRLLVAVTLRLRGLAAEWEHLVVRRNGDQFAILVEATTCAEDATKVADRVLTALAEPFHVEGLELSITASAGVVERLAVGSRPIEVMQAADVALHWAKADGRNRWRLYEEPRSSRDVERYRLSAEMPAAMRRGEFTLVYQPLVHLATNRIAGFEALARWHHPVRGALGADRFVDLAEDTGLIVPLGIQLLEQACQQAAGWRGRVTSPAPYVSVNLSARQLHQPGLAGEILEVLDRTGLPPTRLQLEVTESAAVVVTDPQTLGTLEALAHRGVRIVIDDFGTGYSNFAYLYGLPVHGIKLASQLLRGVGRRQAGHAVLTALISLSSILGLTVTAEGVETAAQARALRALGCEIGQGWHLGRPVHADRLADLLATR
jgi:diguanylate cyclase (GGDEF)-like protein